MPTVPVTVTDASGNVSAPASASWTVATQQATRQIGMSANASEWDQRLSEVGRPGITARRIFAQTLPDSGARGLVTDAVAAGMTPVVSFKLPNFSRAALDAGNYDAAISSEATFLNGLGVPVYATIWHEPSPDVTGVDFQAIHRRLAPLLKKPNVKVGPILNTWVLDNSSNYPKFDGYVADDLIANGTWEFFGYDSYQSGDRPPGTPGPNSLATRMSLINSKIAAHGGANLPQVLGEFNAYEASTLTAVQNTIMGNDSILIACLFNSDVGSKGIVLTGSMLTTFQSFKTTATFKQ